MKVRTGAVTGATAEAIVAIFLAREPRLPPRALAVLNRWQAFNVLWRQQWHPASEDERGTRIVAIVVSLVAHLFFAVFLRSEEHTSELQSLMRISYAVFCLKKKKYITKIKCT